MFGMVGLLTGGLRSASVVAAGPVTTAKLEKSAFDLLYRKNVGFYARFQLAVARQLAADIRNVRGLLTEALDTGDTTAIVERFG
jgi:CRP-like cAMP-binding protein